MPTVFSHAIAAVALKSAFPAIKVPRRLWLLGAACSVAPDLDVLGFGLGIAYGDPFGHRGFTHSLFFAALLGLFCTLAAFPRRSPPVKRGLVWLYLFLATASHGLLDALTNGGLGVAFFAPFENSRYFFPVTPIEVSSFSAGSWRVLASEGPWVWVPSIIFVVLASFLRRSTAPRPISNLNQP